MGVKSKPHVRHCRFTIGKELRLTSEEKPGYDHVWTLRKEISYAFNDLTKHILVTIPTKNIVKDK